MSKLFGLAVALMTLASLLPGGAAIETEAGAVIPADATIIRLTELVVPSGATSS